MFYTVFGLQRIVFNSKTRCSIEMTFRSKCSILSVQVICFEKSKLNIEDMQLIPLDWATYICQAFYKRC